MALPTFAKAIVAAAVAGLAPTATALGTGAPLTSGSTIASVVSAVVGAVLTYLVPNGSSAPASTDPLVVGPRSEPLVISLQTDAPKFLAAFAEGLPGLVQAAASSALTSLPPVPASPVSTPPVESHAPSIVG